MYRVDVRATGKDSNPRHYVIKLEEMREATQNDRLSEAARQAFIEAGLLRAQGTAQPLRKVIEEFEQALKLSRAAGIATWSIA